MRLFFFAAAGLSQSVWDRLDRIAEAHCGERIRMMAGLGMTEASPSCTFTTGPLSVAGYVGVPAPGCELKLVPVDGKLEGRFRGPHIMPGYWRDAAQTTACFDEEGFYCSGDALKLVDPANPQLGLISTAASPRTSSCRPGCSSASVPCAIARCWRDAAGAGRGGGGAGSRVPGAAGLSAPGGLPQLAGLDDGVDAATVLASAPVQDWFAAWLGRLNREASGNASRLEWIALQEEPPSADAARSPTRARSTSAASWPIAPSGWTLATGERRRC